MNTFINKRDLSTYGLSSGAVAGDLAFASAIALDTSTMQREASVVTIEDETRMCLERLNEVLGEGGAGLSDVVKMNCYLADDNDRTEFWRTYDDVFADLGTKEVRLTQVVGIACGCRVELDAVAVRRDATIKA